MPRYEFKNQNTGQIIELQRKIADRDAPPTLAELIEAKVSDADIREGSWIRLTSGGQAMIKGANWGEGKGNWGQKQVIRKRVNTKRG